MHSLPSSYFCGKKGLSGCRWILSVLCLYLHHVRKKVMRHIRKEMNDNFVLRDIRPLESAINHVLNASEQCPN